MLQEGKSSGILSPGLKDISLYDNRIAKRHLVPFKINFFEQKSEQHFVHQHNQQQDDPRRNNGIICMGYISIDCYIFYTGNKQTKQNKTKGGKANKQNQQANNANNVNKATFSVLDARERRNSGQCVQNFATVEYNEHACVGVYSTYMSVCVFLCLLYIL